MHVKEIRVRAGACFKVSRVLMVDVTGRVKSEWKFPSCEDMHAKGNAKGSATAKV